VPVHVPFLLPDVQSGIPGNKLDYFIISIDSLELLLVDFEQLL